MSITIRRRDIRRNIDAKDTVAGECYLWGDDKLLMRLHTLGIIMFVVLNSGSIMERDDIVVREVEDVEILFD